MKYRGKGDNMAIGVYRASPILWLVTLMTA